MYYKMLFDIVIMIVVLDYLICMFIIKFNNWEKFFFRIKWNIIIIIVIIKF